MDRRDIPHDTGFVEVGDRCWVARHSALDVNVGVVAGERGLLVVDTSLSEVAGHRVVDDLRRLGRGEVVAVVNTHEHFDHVLGNAVLREEYGGPPIVAHETAAGRVREATERVRRLYEADPGDPWAGDVVASELVVPDQTFSSAWAVDLGDRFVEVVHPGRGHTGGDAVVRVPDAEVMFAGDLVEESGTPGFGEDSFPLEWPATLDLVLGLVDQTGVVVPGHGVPVGRAFVEAQRDSIGVVAETVRDLASRGLRPEQMADAAAWPYPVEDLRSAFRRGFDTLPHGARTLPLV
ncbi:MAG TPA: MBL fold metallo-hydrolase [Nocardioidaceae bacterium]|nr:MBL fold metallo-hydrolase [Nocardioidaceae bacterium]